MFFAPYFLYAKILKSILCYRKRWCEFSNSCVLKFKYCHKSFYIFYKKSCYSIKYSKKKKKKYLKKKFKSRSFHDKILYWLKYFYGFQIGKYCEINDFDRLKEIFSLSKSFSLASFLFIVKWHFRYMSLNEAGHTVWYIIWPDGGNYEEIMIIICGEICAW